LTHRGFNPHRVIEATLARGDAEAQLHGSRHPSAGDE
jgi:hypothetical protein